MNRALLSLFAILASLSLAQCTKSPEEVALSCINAMCIDERDALSTCLTEGSYRLYVGFVGILPTLMACQPGTLRVESVRELDAEGSMARVTLTTDAEASQSVILLRRDGEWQVDLFMIGWDDTVGRSDMLLPGGL